MSKGKIAGTEPAEVVLEKGETKYFCACGESDKQPFCDGSHRHNDFEPVVFTPKRDGKAFLCMCKQSSNLPYCDGTHNSL